MRRRVVITGIGAVSPLGCDSASLWKGLIDGRSGIRAIDRFDTTDIASKIAGLIPSALLNADLYMSKAEQNRFDNFVLYAVAAAAQAYGDAGYETLSDNQKERFSVVISSGIGGLSKLCETAITLYKDGPRRVSPFFIPSVIINIASGYVAMKYGIRGTNYGIVSACATGNHSIGEAFRSIQHGYCDFALAGGTDNTVCPVGVAGFSAARALSTKYNDTPEKASRPWDKGRDGFVIGEGAGILAIEEYEIAKRRNAKIYGEIIGYGASCDAYHITAPLPDGRGAALAMRFALQDAGLDGSNIDYINAHGTSTQAGDIAEIRAIRSVFRDYSNLNISSTKSATGHLLGAAGAVESIVCLLAMRDSVIPPTLNLSNPEEECDSLNLTPLFAQERRVNISMNNSFGFGGTNASLILRKE
jgi:3-oxoacyl-[acyl-carrier-protein] synthase II